MVPLVVILGAGASRGSGFYPKADLPSERGDMPPLTVDLFDEDEYRSVLRYYDLAHQAGRLIAQERAQNDALGLERALHDLTESEFLHHKHMALAVPPYLQHLLHSVSEACYVNAIHYDRLIERLLRLPYVFFVSLNYDVMLDRRLHGHHPLSNLNDYIDNNRNWSLIKPHGSINWYHETNSTYISARPPIDLAWKPDEFGCVPPDESLAAMREPRYQAGVDPAAVSTRRYPALAAPEGPEDRLVLPDSHRAFFLHQLRNAQKLDILVIGYSGLDREILAHIKSGGCDIRRMTIVDRGHVTASVVLERLRAAGLNPIWPHIVDGDFASWSDDGGMSLLVDEYGGPYPHS
jgi:hypothetical protein